MSPVAGYTSMGQDGRVNDVIQQLRALSAGQLVLLANPVADNVLAAVVDAGARYVDAGRRHDFSIDAGAWRAALTHSDFALAYLASSNVPTATIPDSTRAVEATAAGVTVCWDRRGGDGAAVDLGARLAATGLEVVGPHGAALWVRVAGVPSADIAAAVGRPEVTGRTDWTWRDCVQVRAPRPDDMDALVGALASVRSR